jgi:ribosome-binding factor A
MDSRRQEKVAQLIKEAFSEIVQQAASSLFPAKVLVTITQVKISPDLNFAKIYLSIFNAESPEEVLQAFEANNKDLRHALGNKLRHHLRKIPELEFYRDDTLDYVDRIEQIFKEINKDKDAGNE